MPNWCSNSLTVIGKTQEDVVQFMEAVKAENTTLSFDKLVPCPEELKNTTSTFVNSLDPVENEKQIRENAKQYNWNLTEEKLKEQIDSSNKQSEIYRGNIAKHGYKDWYDFHCEEWGTKWDVKAGEPITGEKIAEYSFESAWTPPVPWLVKIARKFPNCKFILEYDEPGINFHGITYACNENCEDIEMKTRRKPAKPAWWKTAWKTSN